MIVSLFISIKNLFTNSLRQLFKVKLLLPVINDSINKHVLLKIKSVSLEPTDS